MWWAPCALVILVSRACTAAPNCVSGFINGRGFCLFELPVDWPTCKWEMTLRGDLVANLWTFESYAFSGTPPRLVPELSRTMQKTPHLTRPFSHYDFNQSVNLYKESSYRLKVNRLVHWQQLNWCHEIQGGKPNNMLNDLKHVETHEYIDHWLVDAVDWTTVKLVFSASSLLLVLSLFIARCTLLSVFVPWGWSQCSGSSLSPHSFTYHPIFMVHAHCCVSLWLLRHLHSLLLPHRTSSSKMWWTNTLRTSAEDFVTLAENEPFTSHEPNDHFIMEAHVEYTQESTGEQRSPNDFDYDDVTHRQDAAWRVPKTSRWLWRRRPVVLSVVVGQSRRTGRPVVCSFDSQVSSVQETQRHNSEQIRILLERQREQILADFQAEIRKHEFKADYDRRSIQWNDRVVKKEICRAHQRDERRRRDQQILHEYLLKQNWDLRETRMKSLNEMEELKRFQDSTFDTIARRRLVEDQDTILELYRWDSETAEWN